MPMTILTVPLNWREAWPTTNLDFGDIVVAEFDGFGMLCDLAIRGPQGEKLSTVFEEAAELDALLEWGAEGRLPMVQI